MSHTHTSDKTNHPLDVDKEICIIDPEQEREIIYRRTQLRSMQEGIDPKLLNLSSSTIVGRKRNRGCLSESEERSSQRARTSTTAAPTNTDVEKQKIKGPKYMDMLTDDLILQIFKHLPQFPSLIRMRQVCHRWNRLACNARLWTWLSFEGHEHIKSANLNSLCKSLSLHRLRKLSLAKVHSVDENCLRAIPRNECAATLESVDLSWCSAASDRSVVEFSRCPGLKELRLSHCRNVSRRSVRILAVRCPRLEVLDMNCISGLRDSLLQFIGTNCPLLRVLNIANGKSISDVGVGHIARGCPRLEVLDLSWCERVTDLSISKIATHVRGLREIGLSETSVSNLGIGKLTRFCPRLDTIHIAKCEDVSDSGVNFIIQRCSKRLKFLNMARCRNVSNECVKKVLTTCEKLTYLDVSKHCLQRQCRPIADLATSITEQRPDIEIYF